MNYRTIIIDDEPAARRLIISMLKEYADWINIAAEASNGTEAIKQINELKPDLIFLDIHLPDYNGFEVLDKILHQPNVIFTTAYEQYAIKAFETFSIDYLLKPIREERLEQSLQKLKQFGKTSTVTDITQIKNFVMEMAAEKKPIAFPVKQGDKIILIRFENISHFEADDKYVFLFTVDGKKYLTDLTLSLLETKLPSNFIRVQKSYIINKDKVGEIHKHFNGRYIIMMQDKNNSRIQTGLSYFEKVKESFGL